jgi:hypothetical protein
MEVGHYTPAANRQDVSYYYDRFRVGASIFPRSFYFVKVGSSRQDGLVGVSTVDNIEEMVKPPWNFRLHGEVEPQYIYWTLLAWEVMPFGHGGFRSVVLPVRPSTGRYEILSTPPMGAGGDSGLALWWAECERIWQERRTPKSALRFPSLGVRLDYNGLVASQNP